MPSTRLQQVGYPRPDALVRAARAGNDEAWTHLLARYDGLVRSIARSYRLQPSDVDDVVQMTWLRLYRRIDRLREPAAFAGWLTTTARREAMRLLHTHVREQLSDDPKLGECAESDSVEEDVFAAQDRMILIKAIALLPGRQRELMHLLATQPDADYEHISTTLKMPIGSIGPTRARALARLRRDRRLHMHHLDSV